MSTVPPRLAATGVGLLAILPHGAPAAPPATSPAAVLCPADGATARLDARRLVRHLLEARPVPDAVLDADRDGDTLFTEKLAAVLDPAYCARVPVPCTDETVAAFAWHREMLETLLRDDRIEVERLRSPGAAEGAADPGPGTAPGASPSGIGLAEVLDPEDRFIRLTCRATPPAEIEVAGPGEPPAQAGWVRDPDHDEGFRLTSEIDDLSKARTGLGAVKPAEFSISSNLLQDNTTFQVDAVAGYHFDAGRGDEVRAVSVPFLLVERLFSNERDELDKLGAGWQGSAQFPLTPDALQEFAFTPLYLTDSNLESDIGTLKFRWTPTLNADTGVPLGSVRQFGDLLVSTGIDLLTDAGNVFDSGANEDLLAERRFLRVGGRLRLSLRGAADTLFERIQFDLSEKYLYNVNAEIEHINLVEVGFSYLLPEAENYRLTFSFTGGRDEDTLVEKAFWKTQVGIRF
ncbi:MAG TPA: hypothetical protein VFZ01_08620 [Geminicoccaceae bacterium]